MLKKFNVHAYEHVGMCVYVYDTCLHCNIIMWIILQSNVLCIDGIGSYDQASFVLLHKIASYPHLHRDCDATFMHICIRPSCLHVLLS